MCVLGPLPQAGNLSSPNTRTRGGLIPLWSHCAWFWPSALFWTLACARRAWETGVFPGGRRMGGTGGQWVSCQHRPWCLFLLDFCNVTPESL